jgi:glycosyltransferase involved in cell wall biosynthesis
MVERSTDRRLRILILITRAELGGGQTHVADLLRGFREEFDVHLGCGEKGYLTEVAEELGVRTHIVPALVQPVDAWRDMTALRRCIQLIRDIEPDLVHAHTSKAGFIGRAAAKWTGVPSVFTAHTWCFAEGTSLTWKLAGTPLERAAGRWCGRVINVSDANRMLALNRSIGKLDKHVTIHNGISDHAMRARPDDAVATPRIVMLARFAPQKAQTLLIEAVQGISEPFEVVFVGDGPTRAAVERQAAAAGLSGRVKFLGQRLDVPELMASSHIFALFTHWEGFPISILEAMRAGLPTVVSDVGGVREAIDQSCGRIVPAGDVTAFRAALKELLGSPELRGTLGTAARARFERSYTVDAMLDKTVEVYRGVVADPARVRAARQLSRVGQHEA